MGQLINTQDLSLGKLIFSLRFGTAGRSTSLNRATANLPGPGAYQVPERIGKEGSRITISGRVLPTVTEAAKVPGPASYTVKPIEGNKGCKFGNGGGRKQEVRSFAPGPGQYNINTRYQSLKRTAPSWK